MSDTRFLLFGSTFFSLCLAILGCHSGKDMASDILSQAGDHVAVIKNVTVIDGTGRDPYLANVFVDGGRIRRIDQQGDNTNFGTGLVIDGSGKYLIPGFVDLLTHVSFRSRLSASDPYELTALFSDINLTAHERLNIQKNLLKSALSGGVTTFVDSISAISDIKRLKQDISETDYPNFYSLGPIVGPPDGHPYPVHDTAWHYAVDLTAPIAEIRAKVATDFDKWFEEDGLLGIKVSIDSPPEGGHPAATPMPDQVVEAIFNAAKAKGRPIFFISFTEEGIKRGAKYGGNIKLGPPVVLSNRGLEVASDSSFDQLKAANVGVISLLSNWGGGIRSYLSDFESRYPNENSLVYSSYFQDMDVSAKNEYETLFEKYFHKDPWFLNAVYKPVGQNMFDLAKQALGKARRFGLTLLASGDTGSFWVFHGHYFLELQHLSGSLSPMELLSAATFAPAKAIGIENQVGSIEDGKLADMLILGKNPLEQASNFNSIEAVIKSGFLHSTQR